MYMTGEDPGELEIDHDDQNGYNNSFRNLRKATRPQNANNRGVQSNNKIGLKGVFKKYNRYYAQIHKNGKKIHLGTYDTAEEAHKAYCEAADQYFGRFANYG